MRDPRLANFVWETPEERGRGPGRRAALALQDQQRALEQGDWPLALERTRALLEAVQELAPLRPDASAAFWHDCALAVARLTAALHPLLHRRSETPLAQPARSDLCWQLTALLDQTLATPAELPAWVAVLHTQLLLHGAMDWRQRLDAGAGEPGEEPRRARERSAHLFGRAAFRLDPVPEWVTVACRQLGVGPIADPRPAGGGGEPEATGPDPAPPPGSAGGGPAAPDLHSRLWPPSQLAEELEHVLLEGGAQRRLRVGLACIPGAAMLCREGERLDLNLAALLQDPSGVDADPWFEALRDPLRRAQAAGWLAPLELAEPFTSLYGSLAHHWRRGGALPQSQLRRLPLLLEAWNRVLGPAQLQARRLPGHPAEARPEAPPSLQVRPDPLEISALIAGSDALSSVAAAGEEAVDAPLEAVLAQLRRRHLDSGFWQAAATGRADPLEALRLLQREAGFYASSADAGACLMAWYEATLNGLERAGIWVGEPSDDAGALLGLAQLLTLHAGRLPHLGPPLSLEDLLAWMAGREVLYVGWSAAAVLDQHRSGRAFRLFHDLPIVPYGLRAVAMPDSRHPRRPHGGFRDSLDHLIAAVEAEQAARPLDLLLLDAGAYRLPLLEAIERRHGIAGVAPGPAVLQLFGLDRGDLPRWREQSRDPAMWRPLA